MRPLVVLVGLAACHHDAPVIADASQDGGTPADAELPPTTLASGELCKLLSNRNTADPTPNDVQHRANVLGADLGIPVVFGDRLFILFGDTIGYAGIWGAGESHPDAVGFGADTATAIASIPSLLCTDLQIITLPPAQSIGPTVDPSVHADFAGATMAPPAGHAIGEFIHNPAGRATTFPNLPGDFEVPSGAFAAGGAIYIFYTTVDAPSTHVMTGGYLARWSGLGAPDYQILYAIADPSRFINVAAEVSGDYVYLFGTGAYRASPIAIARKRLDSLDTPGIEELGMVTATPGYGETSVRYFPELDRWLLLAEESLPASNRIVAYVARHPEGPWSAPIIVHDMADPAFRATYCCTTDDACTTPQLFNCDQTGFYGTYLLPGVATSGDTFTITYTMSSFSPYNVALFQTTFQVP